MPVNNIDVTGGCVGDGIGVAVGVSVCWIICVSVGESSGALLFCDVVTIDVLREASTSLAQDTPAEFRKTNMDNKPMSKVLPFLLIYTPLIS
jgi:hypothetical protein